MPTDERLLCDTFLRSIEFDEKDYKLGRTKIFLRPGKYETLTGLKAESMELAVTKFKSFILQRKWGHILFIMFRISKRMLCFWMEFNLWS